MHQHALTLSRNILAQETSTLGSSTQPDVGGNAEVHAEALKDKVDAIDDTAAKGPKKADQSSGGRVMVAEQGDLHDLAARRQP